ncbi:hypothetical protein M1N58_00230 [Dehalococcoidales bacterium]|nr:hypothetical protein [Dehalococcoidales bacterium]
MRPGYMERMDMHSRNEYLKVLREKYLKARTKREKSLWQYRSGKEVCHQEDTARGRPGAEAEEEKEGDLRQPS